MKILFSALLFISSVTFVQAQDKALVKNSVDVTIGGMGIGISVNTVEQYLRKISILLLHLQVLVVSLR